MRDRDHARRSRGAAHTPARQSFWCQLVVPAKRRLKSRARYLGLSLTAIVTMLGIAYSMAVVIG